MDNAMIALATAMVGVIGTLLSPVLSQRLIARVQSDQLERQQRAADIQWQREQEKAEQDRKRSCYTTTNSAYRRYRVQLMNYLWHVHQDGVTPELREQLEEARHAHHAAFAEAQMIASTRVLAELDTVAKALSETYRRTKCLEEGTPDPDGSFEEIQADLHWLWERWKQMRSIMRADLGIHDDGSRP
ncbi:hypothetical protein [Streptomyces sp. RKCA744]|uniref:hypothetical protein n=1 Tax=Streptomyces sp. RKCA744 TaxID=2959340 RepID=UPI00209D8991|nr:hypothetical protein [Streptomyces sp. RKCA744]MCO8301297.1 hypothetical protein [Streptomyces sp. RKCA744]